MAYTNIDDPSAHFQVATYSGSGGTGGHAIVNDGNSDLQPDLVWLKQRSYASSHRLMDSSRGGNKMLESDTVNIEATYGYISSFDTDGFTLGYSDTSFDGYGREYVGWQWKANGGTTSSNTSGTITTTVQANTDAGFNIVTYTGNGVNSNFGHGMGEQPDMVIVKNRTSSANWCVWHKDLTSSYYMQLDTTISQQTGPWDGLDPSSGVVYIYSGGLVNANGSNYVAYIFKGKQGYSKFGKYTGNGNANGPFVHTGFRPAFVMVKRSDAAENWAIIDSTRDPYNLATKFLRPDETTAETAGNAANMDLLSNGFKLRNTDTKSNASGGTYIYMAFAENPFVTSTGIPTTAR